MNRTLNYPCRFVPNHRIQSRRFTVTETAQLELLVVVLQERSRFRITTVETSEFHLQRRFLGKREKIGDKTSQDHNPVLVQMIVSDPG